jgi:DNA repair exonuclease SbcCD ATPase subunit
MPGTYQYDLEIKSNVEKLLKDMKQVQDRLDTVEGREYTIKFNIDEKKLSSVISNLEKMLDSLGKGTGDFKQFENLSKELSSIVSEVQSLSKAFGKVDDSGAKTLLSSIQNIDKSLSELSQNILNVNKNMNNMGGNTSGAVKQVKNISNAYQDAAKEAEKLADAESKIGRKANISSGMKDIFPKTSENLEQVAQSEQKVQQEAVAIKSKWEQAEKAIQNYMNAVTKLNNLRASDKSTGKKSYEIAGQIEEIEKLKKEAYDARQVLSSMINPQNVDTDTWKRYVDVINRLDQASNGSAESVNRLKDSLKNVLNSELNSLQNSIDKYQKIITQAQTYPSDFHPSTEYNTKLAKLESANEVLKNYKVSLQGVTELTKEQQNQINRLTQNCEKAATEFKNLSAAEKGTIKVGVEKAIQRINKDLAENTKYSAEAKAGLNALLEQLKSGDPSINLRKITEEIIKIENAEIAAGRAGKSLWDIFKTKSTYGFIGQMQSYLSMYVGFYGMVNGVKKAVSTITELDTALVDLKKTTAMNENQLENFYYDSNNVAKQMGVTTKEIIDQASAWSRLGYSTAEAATTMAKLSSQFASISPGMSVDESQSGLVSIMKAWSINPDQVKSEIMDPINKLGKLLPKHTVMYGAIKYSIVDNYIG